MIWNRITWIPLPNRWQNSMDWFLLDQKNRFPMDFPTQIVRSSHCKGHPIGHHPARKESIYTWNLEIAKLSISPNNWKGLNYFQSIWPIQSSWKELVQERHLIGYVVYRGGHVKRCHLRAGGEKPHVGWYSHEKSKISWIYPIYHDIYIYIYF